MPYCPRCDIEFIDSETTCPNCKGSLSQSKEAEAEMEETSQSSLLRGAKIYVKKSQKYEDLKSSASALLLVGAGFFLFSALCWLNVINLPMTGLSLVFFKTVTGIMGAASLAGSAYTYRLASRMSGQVEEEDHTTREIMDWFLSTYSKETIDNRLDAENQNLTPEEVALKRFELIQDYLITGRDLPDQMYVESLSEEIYTKLFE